MRLLNYFFKLAFLIFISPLAFAHVGEHEKPKCFLTIGNTTLNLNGYQFQSQYPEHSYCRIFPELGQTLITVESVHELENNEQIALKLLKFNEKAKWFLNFDGAFFPLKQMPLKSFNSGINLIQADIKEAGIYALEIEWHEEKQIFYQRFLFLAGIPLTKIALFIMTGIFLLIAIIAIKKFLIQESA